MSNKAAKFIDVDALIKEKNPGIHRFIPRFILRYLSETVIHESQFNEFMTEHFDVLNFDFCRAVCEHFDVKVRVEGLENIPKKGGVIFAANHPLGGMDAMVVMSTMDQCRTDVKFLVNDVLMNIPNLKKLFVGVNKFGLTARDGIRAVDEAFAADNALFIFPAGLVSRMTQYKVIRDLDWKKTFVTKSRKYNKPIVPVLISGQLSNRFYRLAKIRKFLGIRVNVEMLLLAQELLKQGGKTIVVKYGKPILPSELNKSIKDQEWAYEIKKRAYNL